MNPSKPSHLDHDEEIKRFERIQGPDQEPRNTLARIVTLTHPGAVVRLANGEEAFLPWKQIWPRFKVHDSFDAYRVSEALQAGQKVVSAAQNADHDGRMIEVGDQLLVIPYDTEFGRRHRQMVSHVRTFNNPWTTVAQWNEHDVVSFIVEVVTDSWAWGDIDIGIRARVSLDGLIELLPDSRWRGHQMPLPGDEVAGYFSREQIDEKQQIINLDYVGYVKGQVSVDDILSNTRPLSPGTQPPDDYTNLTADLTLLVNRASIKTLLLVDDEREFCNSLRHYLVNVCGVEVLACTSLEEAKDMVNKRGSDMDLAIIDVNLSSGPGEVKDHHGLRLALYIQALFPSCPIELTTGEEIKPYHTEYEQATSLIIRDILSKPFGIDGLHRALSAAATPGKLLTQFVSSSGTQAYSPGTIDLTDIDTILVDIKKSLNAEAAVLFRVNPITDRVIIEALAGPDSKYHHEKEKLAWSPIRDAAVDGEYIYTGDAMKPTTFPKHRYLQLAYHYRSCVGVPITIGAASYEAYALFAFHPEANRFDADNDVDLTKRAAREIGQLLRIQKLQQRIYEMKPFEMMGQSYGSMAHDLYNSMVIDVELETIKGLIQRNELEKANTQLKSSIERAQRSERIVKGFKEMVQAQSDRTQIQPFDVLAKLSTITKRLAGEIGKGGGPVLTTALHVSSSARLMMRPSHLDQLLTNLVLNAAQQYADLHLALHRSGEVRIVALEEVDIRGLPWLVIQVDDNGPGIHKRDFERVFDIHYTTKEHGCGMGLDICRKIAEDTSAGTRHGHVHVLRSILLGGCTFEVRLPLSNQYEVEQ
jgi:signal transduction histidine kinase/CheY-like chemotaxis protein